MANSWEKGFVKEAALGGLLNKITGAAGKAEARAYTASRNAAARAAEQLRKDRITKKLNPVGGYAAVDAGNVPKPVSRPA